VLFQRADQARASGIQLVAIGLGQSVLYEELSNITNNDNLIFQFGHDDLTNVTELQTVQEKICECRFTRI